MATINPQAQQIQMQGNENKGSFASAAPVLGMVGDFVNYFANKEQNKFDRQYNAREAAISRAFNKESQLEAERYNSITRQVSDAKQAGLNPALLYQGAPTSQVTANSSSPASAPQRSEMKLDALGAARLYAENRRIDAEVENLQSSTNLNQSKEENQEIINSNQHVRNYIENSKLLAEIDKLLEDKNLAAEQRQNLSELRESVKQLNEAHAKQANADAQYTSGVGTRLAESNISVNNSVVPKNNAETALAKAKTKTEGTIQALNNAKTETEGTIQGLNKAKTVTEEFVQTLHESSSRLNHVNADRIAFDLHLDQAQKSFIQDFVQKNDLPKGSEKALMLALDDFAKSVGKELPKQSVEVISSWLKADNILPFVNDLLRTYQWNSPKNGSDSSPAQTSTSQPSKPVTPSQSSGSHNVEDAKFIASWEKYCKEKFTKQDQQDVFEFGRTHNRLETARYINKLYVERYRHSNKR